MADTTAVAAVSMKEGIDDGDCASGRGSTIAIRDVGDAGDSIDAVVVGVRRRVSARRSCAFSTSVASSCCSVSLCSRAMRENSSTKTGPGACVGSSPGGNTDATEVEADGLADEAGVGRKGKDAWTAAFAPEGLRDEEEGDDEEEEDEEE